MPCLPSGTEAELLLAGTLEVIYLRGKYFGSEINYFSGDLCGQGLLPRTGDEAQ